MITEYSTDIADLICFKIIEGKSLVKTCEELDVNYRLVFNWLKEHAEFLDNYTRAREIQADSLADGVLDVADDSTIPADERRVRIDARKWYAGKLKPKKYGDSTQIKHADADGNKISVNEVLNQINGSTSGLPRADETPK